MTAPPVTSTETARRSKRLLRPSPETTLTPPPPPLEKHRRKETEADDSHAIAGLLAIAGKRASREYLQLYRFHAPRCRAPLPAPPAGGEGAGRSARERCSPAFRSLFIVAARRGEKQRED